MPSDRPSPTSAPVTAPVTGRRRRRRWPWVAAATAVVVIGAAAAQGSPDTSPAPGADRSPAATSTLDVPAAAPSVPAAPAAPSKPADPSQAPETSRDEAAPAPVETTAPKPPETTAPSGGAPATAPARPGTGGETKPPAGTAAAVLATLPVKGRAPMTGYSRSQFGPAWADVDRNGCDTRNDVLARDLTARTTKPGTHGCVIATGTLADPYSATRIAFVRGVGTSTAVQIDHVVALGDAWQKGAQQLSAATRERLANDPLNLLAVQGRLNSQKSDGDAATWLPPNKAFRCQYVARQVAVKHTYGLWVTAAEHDAIARVLATCPGQKVPTGATAPVVHATGTPTPPPAASGSGGGGSGATSGTGSSGKHPASAPPVSRNTCPSWAPIKGNASSRIFHVPGGAYYDRTNPEICFATRAAALADGYRASQR